MAGETVIITIVGNLTADPEIRTTHGEERLPRHDNR